MIKLVLNRFSAKKGILPQMIQSNMKKPILAVIPEDEMTTVTSMTSAKPFVISAPRAEITQAYFNLVRTVASSQILEKLAQLKKPSDAMFR